MYRLRAVPITVSRSLWRCVVLFFGNGHRLCRIHSSRHASITTAGFSVLHPSFVSKINSSRRFSPHLLLVFICHGWIKCTLKYVAFSTFPEEHSVLLYRQAFLKNVFPFWRELFFSTFTRNYMCALIRITQNNIFFQPTWLLWQHVCFCFCLHFVEGIEENKRNNGTRCLTYTCCFFWCSRQIPCCSQSRQDYVDDCAAVWALV